MRKNRIGKIDISELNVPPEKHEYETAKFFANRGFDVAFIGPHYNYGVKNADFIMNNMVWETKSPVGSSARTYEDNLRKAIKQSENVIFDLRRLKEQDEVKCIKVLKRNLYLKGLKRLLIIQKDGRLLTNKDRSDIIYLEVARPTPE